MTVLFPWGTLLRAVLGGEARDLQRLLALCQPGGVVEVVTAIDAEADAAELERLGLGTLDFTAVARAWAAAGFAEVAVGSLPVDHPYQTTWWKRIRQRQEREPLRLRAVAPGRP